MCNITSLPYDLFPLPLSVSLRHSLTTPFHLSLSNIAYLSKDHFPSYIETSRLCPLTHFHLAMSVTSRLSRTTSFPLASLNRVSLYDRFPNCTVFNIKSLPTDAFPLCTNCNIKFLPTDPIHPCVVCNITSLPTEPFPPCTVSNITSLPNDPFQCL